MAMADATTRYGRRDYSMVGRDAEEAVRQGLHSAEWYHTDIPGR